MFDSLVMIGYGTWSFLLCFVWLPFIAFFGFNFCCLYQIIVFQFGLGANAHYVILELYAQGNIILTDSEYMIMTLLRSHRDDNKGFAIMSRHRYPIEICRVFERTTVSKLQESLTAFVLKDHDAKQIEPKEQNGGKKGGKSNDSTGAKQYTLKNILGDALGYGPQLSEHIILDAGLVPTTKLSEDKKLDDNEIQLLVQAVIVFEDWLEDIINGQKVPEGYILMQKQILANDTTSESGGVKKVTILLYASSFLYCLMAMDFMY
jgi:hypothetical protein